MAGVEVRRNIVETANYRRRGHVRVASLILLIALCIQCCFKATQPGEKAPLPLAKFNWYFDENPLRKREIPFSDLRLDGETGGGAGAGVHSGPSGVVP